MDNQIKYTVTAEDLVSGKLQGMNAEAKGLETTMGGLSKVLGTLGVGFAVFKGLEYVKGGIEKFHELEQITAKVEANLESTGEKAGMSLADIEGYSKSLSSGIQASRVDVMDMASQLLTFPAITKDVFQSSMSMVADIAKQTGHGLSETAIMYGKALNSPIDGLSKMQRYGVMFTQQEKDKIGALQESGHLIDAQKAMMDSIAHSGYAGVAKKMFDADPLAQFNKKMGSLQLAVGEASMSFLQWLAPALNNVADKFKALGVFVKDTIGWFKQHSVITHTLGVFLGALVTMIGLYVTYQKLSAMWTAFTTASMVVQTFQMGVMSGALAGLSTAGSIWAGVMAVVNAVMDANPIALIIIGIAGLIAVVVECYKHFETFRAIIWAVGAVIKEYVMIWVDLFKGFGQVLQGVFTLDMDMIKSGFNKITDTVKNSAMRIGKSASDGYKAGLADFAKDKKEDEKEHSKKGLAGHKMITPSAPMDYSKKDPKGTKGVQANKAVTVNITIGSLINDFKISTTNIQESTQAIHDKVVQALTGAVNDSQLIAGQ